MQYRVRAVTEAGEGAFSIRSTFILASKPTILLAPVLVNATRDLIELEWVIDTDGGSVITGYQLYQTNVTEGGESIIYDGSHIPTVTSHQITQVVSGHSYKFRVIALNRVGES